MQYRIDKTIFKKKTMCCCHSRCDKFLIIYNQIRTEPLSKYPYYIEDNIAISGYDFIYLTPTFTKVMYKRFLITLYYLMYYYIFNFIETMDLYIV